MPAGSVQVVPSLGPRLFQDALLRGELDEIAAGIVRVVARSFTRGQHPMRHITQDEVKRRTLICKRWMHTLCEPPVPNDPARGGYGWTIQRGLCHLGEALDAELRGQKDWSPIRSRTLYADDPVALGRTGT